MRAEYTTPSSSQQHASATLPAPASLPAKTPKVLVNRNALSALGFSRMLDAYELMTRAPANASRNAARRRASGRRHA